MRAFTFLALAASAAALAIQPVEMAQKAIDSDALFTKIDKDKSGTISLPEMTAALCSLGFRKPVAAAIVKHMSVGLPADFAGADKQMFKDGIIEV